ncbi:VWA domain-containing protein [bacterium]|nr:VWA domain-containing protein [bacterium]
MSELGVAWGNLENSYLALILAGCVALLIFTAYSRNKLLSRLKLTVENNSFEAPRWRRIKTILFVIGLALGVLAALGPQWGDTEETYRAEGLDLCVALDLSQSMNAEDANPSRLQLAKNQLSIFVENLRGDRVSLVGFAGSGYVAAPLTVDYHSFVDFMEPMSSEFLSDQATNIGGGIEACLSALGVDKVDDPTDLEFEASKVILLVSDGEDTVEDYKGAINRSQNLNIPIYSVAMGTQQGSNIPIRDSRGSLEGYVRDPETSKPVITKLLDKALLDLAEKTKAKVFYSSQGVEAWEFLTKSLADYKRSSKDAGTLNKKEHRFQIPLLFSILFILLSFLLPETKCAWKKLLLPCLIFLCFSFSSFAETVENPYDIFTSNSGVSAFNKGEFDEAEDKFSDVIARNPHDSTARFNWTSNSLHRFTSEQAKDKEEKEQQGQGAEEKTFTPSEVEPIKQELSKLLETSQSEKMQKALQYQLGQSEELLGKNKEAMIEYYKSLKKEPWPDLDEKTRKNIARLIAKEDAKSKSQQQGKGGGQGGGGGGQGEDQNKGQGQQPQNSGGQPQKPKFDDTNIDEKQAKKILSSVSSEEKEVQQRKAQAEAGNRARKRREQGKGSGQNGKPW